MFGKSTSKRFDDPKGNTPGPGQYELGKVGEIGRGVGANPMGGTSARFTKDKVHTPSTPSRRQSTTPKTTPLPVVSGRKRPLAPAVIISKLQNELASVEKAHKKVLSEKNQSIAELAEEVAGLVESKSELASEYTRVCHQAQSSSSALAAARSAAARATNACAAETFRADLATAALDWHIRLSGNLVDEINQLRDDVNYAEDTAKALSNVNVTLGSQVMCLEDALADAETKNLCLEQLLTNESDHVTSLQGDIAALTLFTSKQEHTIAELERELAAVKCELIDSTDEYAGMLNTLRDDVAVLTTERERDAATAQATVDALEAHLSAAQAQNTALKHAAAKKEKQLRATIKTHTDSVLATRTQLEAMVAAIECDNASIHTYAESLAESLTQSEERAKHAEEQAAVAEAALAVARAEAAANNQLIGSVAKELGTVASISLMTWTACDANASLDASEGGVVVSTACTTTEEVLNALHSVRAAVETINMAMAETVDELESEHAHVCAVHASETRKHADEITKLTDRVLSLQDKLECAVSENNNLTRTLESVRGNLHATTEAYEDRLSVLESQVSDSAATIDRMRADHFDEVEQLCSELRLIKQESRDVAEEYAAEVRRLEAVASEASVNENASIRANVATLKAENAELRKEAAELSAVNAQLMASTNAKQRIHYHKMIKKENAELRKKNIELNNRIMKLTLAKHSSETRNTHRRMSERIAAASPAAAARVRARVERTPKTFVLEQKFSVSPDEAERFDETATPPQPKFGDTPTRTALGSRDNMNMPQRAVKRIAFGSEGQENSPVASPGLMA